MKADIDLIVRPAIWKNILLLLNSPSRRNINYAQIARKMNMHIATVIKAIKDLKEINLVAFEKVGRIVKVELTTKGKKVIKELIKIEKIIRIWYINLVNGIWK